MHYNDFMTTYLLFSFFDVTLRISRQNFCPKNVPYQFIIGTNPNPSDIIKKLFGLGLVQITVFVLKALIMFLTCS